MSRNRRFPRVLLLAALLCAAFASAAAPDAQAAAHTYYVDSAKDDGVGGTPSIFCAMSTRMTPAGATAIDARSSRGRFLPRGF